MRIFSLLLFLLTTPAFALPVGNPAESALLMRGIVLDKECEWYTCLYFVGGYQGDFNFNRKMRTEPFTREGGTLHFFHEHYTEKYELYTQAGYAGFQFFNRLAFYGTFGQSCLAIQGNAFPFVDNPIDGQVTGRFALDSGSSFSWGVGISLILWELEETFMGMDAKYFHTNPDVKRVTIQNTTFPTSVSIYPDSLPITFQEWQLSLTLSQQVGSLVPYGALRYARAKSRFHAKQIQIGETGGLPVDFILTRFRDQHNFGYALGVSLIQCYVASLSAECRFINEKALCIQGHIRF